MKKILLILSCVIASLCNNAYGQFDVNNDLLLYLNFDGENLGANNQSVDATNVTATADAGKFSTAAYFDGSTYLAMTPITAYDPHTKAIAFSYWIKTNVTTGEDIFVYNAQVDPSGLDQEGRFAMSLRSDDILGADIGWSGGNLESEPGLDNTSGLISDNNWHHVVAAFTINGTSIKLYIDNTLVEEIGTGGMQGFDVTDHLLFLGMGCADFPGFELGWATTFTGSIDDFRMYQTDAQLTESDVAALYTFIPTAIETVPVAAIGLSATAISSTTIEVNWSAAEKATGYTVWRKTGTAGTWAEVKEIEEGAVVLFIDNALEEATEYFYKIVAWNLVGDAPASVEVSATTLSGVGIAGNSALALKVYPNPASGSVWLSTSNNGTATITDLQGKVILLKAVSGDNLIDITGLQSGLYLVSFTSSGSTSFQKLVVK